jgi:hypothetical protein
MIYDLYKLLGGVRERWGAGLAQPRCEAVGRGAP